MLVCYFQNQRVCVCVCLRVSVTSVIQFINFIGCSDFGIEFHFNQLKMAAIHAGIESKINRIDSLHRNAVKTPNKRLHIGALCFRCRFPQPLSEFIYFFSSSFFFATIGISSASFNSELNHSFHCRSKYFDGS